MFSTIININRPDGATYSQTVYVPKYSSREHLGKLTFYVANISFTIKTTKYHLYTGYFEKIKALRFICRRLIPENLAPEVQIKIYANSIIVRF